jgi:CheY-like chemotaxis protein
MSARILVADDSVTIRKFVALAFENESVEVSSAVDGAEALERLESFKPDVVLADVFMPGLSGYELCEQIKNSPELHDTGVILLVGMFEPFDQDEALRVRCDGHLSKPIDPAELLGTVRHLLQKRQPAHSAEAGDPPERPLNVSERTRSSFTGSGRILDIISPALDTKTPRRAAGEPGQGIPAEAHRAAEPAQPAEGLLASRVDDAVRRLAPAMIREIVEEILPEMVRQSSR